MANDTFGSQARGVDSDLRDSGFPFSGAGISVLPLVFEHHRTDELPQPRGPDVPSYLIVRKEVWDDVHAVLNVAQIMNGVVERLNANCRRELRHADFTKDGVTAGLVGGSLRYFTQFELVEALMKTGKMVLGVTGGGDCAGIADCMSSFAQDLDPNLVLLGIKDAGKGLTVNPDKLAEQLILVDKLLANDMKGQASTPFGSIRLNALSNGSVANTLANVAKFGAVVGTGGNGNLEFMELLAQKFPEKVVVGSPKTLDSDVCVDGQRVQALGFRTAVEEVQKSVYSFAQNAATHKEVRVMQIFGRECGRLSFEAGRMDPGNFQKLQNDPATKDLARKIVEFGRTVRILVPEKPTSLLSIAKEVAKCKEQYGSCVVVVAEGFVPPEVREWTGELYAFVEKERVAGREVNRDLLVKMIGDGGNSKKAAALKEILQSDAELAEHFMKLVLGRERDDSGKRKVKLMRLREFVEGAIRQIGKISKVGEGLETYHARGESPNKDDQVMGQKSGKKMAQLVRERVIGGRAVVYLEGMNLDQDPVVLNLVRINNENNLADKEVYPEDMLRRGGVFWKD